MFLASFKKEEKNIIHSFSEPRSIKIYRFLWKKLKIRVKQWPADAIRLIDI